MSDSASRYTSFRIALASGILGAAGASLGWLVWLAARVANPELLVTVLVGATLGLVVHWIQHYVRVARRERQGNGPQPGASRQPQTIRSRAAIAWAAGFGLLGLVTEHLVAEMAAEFLQPFLASLAALLPAGMILGWTMSQGRWKDENAYTTVLGGMALGIAIGLVTGIIWTLGFGSAPWLALISWWGLIGLGTRLVVRRQRHAVRILDPILAVVLIFVVTLGLDRLPASPSWYDKFGAYKGVPGILRLMAAEIHESPGLPATFWVQAEKRYIDKEAGRNCPATSIAPSATVAVDTSVKLTRDTIARPISADPLQAAIDRMAQQDTTPAHASTSRVPAAPLPGEETEFFRSWLVMLLFAAGLGVAPWLEQTLRPIDYPNSETYRRDITLTIVVVLMLIGACVYARMDQRREAARIEACRWAALQAPGR